MAGNSGLLVDVASDKPRAYFDLFFGNQYWEDLAFQTNLYAEQDLEATNVTPASRKARWKPVTPGELKVFTGLTIGMLHLNIIHLIPLCKKNVYSIDFSHQKH